MDSGIYHSYNYMVMKKLGSSLQKIMNESEDLFSEKTVKQIGIQMVNIYQ